MPFAPPVQLRPLAGVQPGDRTVNDVGWENRLRVQGFREEIPVIWLISPALLASSPTWDMFQMGIPTTREGTMDTVREYEVKLDARNRLTIRDAGYEHYHVQELEDGTVVLKPRVLVSPTLLTAETLRKAEAERDIEEFETAEELFQDLES